MDVYAEGGRMKDFIEILAVVALLAGAYTLLLAATKGWPKK
jgi:hypothetical protein